MGVVAVAMAEIEEVVGAKEEEAVAVAVASEEATISRTTAPLEWWRSEWVA